MVNVAFLSGKVAPVVVAVIAAVLELRRVVANVELRQPAVRVALYLTLAAVRPTPNVVEGVFYSSVTRNVGGVGNARAVVNGIIDDAGSVTERIGSTAGMNG